MTTLTIIGTQPLWPKQSSEYFRAINKNPSTHGEEEEDGPELLAGIEALYEHRYHSISTIRDSAEEDEVLGPYQARAYLRHDRALSLYCIIYVLTPRDHRVFFERNQADPSTLDRIRSLLNRNAEDTRAPWVKQVEQSARITQAFLRDLQAPRDTCNITISIQDAITNVQRIREDGLLPIGAGADMGREAHQDDHTAHHCRILRNHRSNLERVGIDIARIELSEQLLVITGGRMHIIFAKEPRDISALLPTIVHAQYAWFFSDRLTRCASELHFDLWNDKRMAAGNSQARASAREFLFESTDNFIHAMETFLMRHEFTKRSLEGATDAIYSAIDRKWRIEDSLKAARRYIRFLSGFRASEQNRLERSHERRIASIGLFLALLGMISIVASVVGMLDVFEKFRTAWDYWRTMSRSSLAVDGLLSVAGASILSTALAILRKASKER